MQVKLELGVKACTVHLFNLNHEGILEIIISLIITITKLSNLIGYQLS